MRVNLTAIGIASSGIMFRSHDGRHHSCISKAFYSRFPKDEPLLAAEEARVLRRYPRYFGEHCGCSSQAHPDGDVDMNDTSSDEDSSDKENGSDNDSIFPDRISAVRLY